MSGQPQVLWHVGRRQLIFEAVRRFAYDVHCRDRKCLRHRLARQIKLHGGRLHAPNEHAIWRGARAGGRGAALVDAVARDLLAQSKRLPVRTCGHGVPGKEWGGEGKGGLQGHEQQAEQDTAHGTSYSSMIGPNFFLMALTAAWSSESFPSMLRCSSVSAAIRSLCADCAAENSVSMAPRAAWNLPRDAARPFCSSFVASCWSEI